MYVEGEVTKKKSATIGFSFTRSKSSSKVSILDLPKIWPINGKYQFQFIIIAWRRFFIGYPDVLNENSGWSARDIIIMWNFLFVDNHCDILERPAKRIVTLMLLWRQRAPRRNNFKLKLPTQDFVVVVLNHCINEDSTRVVFLVCTSSICTR